MPEGCSAVFVEITYNEGDDISKVSDEELISHTVDGLVRIGILPSRDAVVHTGGRPLQICKRRICCGLPEEYQNRPGIS